MTVSKKGHNIAIHWPTEKKIRVRLIFVLMLYIKFQVPSGSLVLQPTKGVTDRRTDGRTDGQMVRWTDGQAQINMPPQLLRSWGHKNGFSTPEKACISSRVNVLLTRPPGTGHFEQYHLHNR